MVIHSHKYGADTHFSILSGPLSTNPLSKYILVISRGWYQQVDAENLWAYYPDNNQFP